MLGQQAPHHAGTTLVLTVHALLGAYTLVALWKGQRGRFRGSLGHQVPHLAPPPSPPTSKASPLKSQPQNSHLRRRLGQSCCKCAGRSRRLSFVGQRLGQGITLKLQVFRWLWGGGGRQRETVSACQGRGSPVPPTRDSPAGGAAAHSSGSPPHCGCSGWAAPTPAPPAPGLGRSG